eukprot:GHVP01049805.1.p1 GENE.GHVP01049805.1~~GHVP01049805.1.p1  ORF type:complete len:1583 (+),score=302.07 GHVP01049805.1:853-5601(+)
MSLSRISSITDEAQSSETYNLLVLLLHRSQDFPFLLRKSMETASRCFSEEEITGATGDSPKTASVKTSGFPSVGEASVLVSQETWKSVFSGKGKETNQKKEQGEIILEDLLITITSGMSNHEKKKTSISFVNSLLILSKGNTTSRKIASKESKIFSRPSWQSFLITLVNILPSLPINEQDEVCRTFLWSFHATHEEQSSSIDRTFGNVILLSFARLISERITFSAIILKDFLTELLPDINPSSAEITTILLLSCFSQASNAEDQILSEQNAKTIVEAGKTMMTNSNLPPESRATGAILYLKCFEKFLILYPQQTSDKIFDASNSVSQPNDYSLMMDFIQSSQMDNDVSFSSSSEFSQIMMSQNSTSGLVSNLTRKTVTQPDAHRPTVIQEDEPLFIEEGKNTICHFDADMISSIEKILDMTVYSDLEPQETLHIVVILFQIISTLETSQSKKSNLEIQVEKAKLVLFKLVNEFVVKLHRRIGLSSDSTQPLNLDELIMHVFVKREGRIRKISAPSVNVQLYFFILATICQSCMRLEMLQLSKSFVHGVADRIGKSTLQSFEFPSKDNELTKAIDWQDTNPQGSRNISVWLIAIALLEVSFGFLSTEFQFINSQNDNEGAVLTSKNLERIAGLISIFSILTNLPLQKIPDSQLNKKRKSVGGLDRTASYNSTSKALQNRLSFSKPSMTSSAFVAFTLLLKHQVRDCSIGKMLDLVGLKSETAPESQEFGTEVEKGTQGQPFEVREQTEVQQTRLINEFITNGPFLTLCERYISFFCRALVFAASEGSGASDQNWGGEFDTTIGDGVPEVNPVEQRSRWCVVSTLHQLKVHSVVLCHRDSKASTDFITETVERSTPPRNEVPAATEPGVKSEPIGSQQIITQDYCVPPIEDEDDHPDATENDLRINLSTSSPDETLANIFITPLQIFCCLGELQSKISTMYSTAYFLAFEHILITPFTLLKKYAFESYSAKNKKPQRKTPPTSRNADILTKYILQKLDLPATDVSSHALFLLNCYSVAALRSLRKTSRTQGDIVEFEDLFEPELSITRASPSAPQIALNLIIVVAGFLLQGEAKNSLPPYLSKFKENPTFLTLGSLERNNHIEEATDILRDILTYLEFGTDDEKWIKIYKSIDTPKIAKLASGIISFIVSKILLLLEELDLLKAGCSQLEKLKGLKTKHPFDRSLRLIPVDTDSPEVLSEQNPQDGENSAPNTPSKRTSLPPLPTPKVPTKPQTLKTSLPQLAPLRQNLQLLKTMLSLFGNAQATKHTSNAYQDCNNVLRQIVIRMPDVVNALPTSIHSLLFHCLLNFEQETEICEYLLKEFPNSSQRSVDFLFEKRSRQFDLLIQSVTVQQFKVEETFLEILTKGCQTLENSISGLYFKSRVICQKIANNFIRGCTKIIQLSNMTEDIPSELHVQISTLVTLTAKLSLIVDKQYTGSFPAQWKASRVKLQGLVKSIQTLMIKEEFKEIWAPVLPHLEEFSCPNVADGVEVAEGQEDEDEDPEAVVDDDLLFQEEIGAPNAQPDNPDQEANENQENSTPGEVSQLPEPTPEEQPKKRRVLLQRRQWGLSKRKTNTKNSDLPNQQ